MKICLMLTCPNPVVDERRLPSTISRWVSWPCVPRIGEKFRWAFLQDYYQYEMLEDDDSARRVVDVIHEPVHRTLWQRLCGKPREVVMVFFHVPDQSLLADLLDEDPRWKNRDRPLV